MLSSFQSRRSAGHNYLHLRLQGTVKTDLPAWKILQLPGNLISTMGGWKHRMLTILRSCSYLSDLLRHSDIVPCSSIKMQPWTSMCRCLLRLLQGL